MSTPTSGCGQWPRECGQHFTAKEHGIACRERAKQFLRYNPHHHAGKPLQTARRNAVPWSSELPEDLRSWLGVRVAAPASYWSKQERFGLKDKVFVGTVIQDSGRLLVRWDCGGSISPVVASSLPDLVARYSAKRNSPIAQ